MNRISKANHAGRAVGGLAGNRSYRALGAASRPLFAAPVDLTTLVIAQEIQRKAQAERERDLLREAAYQYDMPVQRERHERNERKGRNPEPNNERGGWNHSADFDE